MNEDELLCLSCMQDVVADSSTIRCVKCDNYYHTGKCSNVTKTALKAFTAKERETWSCPTCSIQARQQSKQKSSDPSLADIMDEIKRNGSKTSEVLEKMVVLESKFEALSQSHCELERRVTCNTSALNATEEHVAALRHELSKANNELSSLRRTVNDLEQYERRFNLEIRGVAEKQNEDIYAIINDIAEQLEVPVLTKNDLEAAHRLPSKAEQAAPIIVRFKERLVRDMWLDKRAQLRQKQQQRDQTQENPVFICENLTAFNKALLWETRRVAKEKKYAYVWVRNGHIYVRQEDGTRAKRIVNRCDLAEL